MKPEIEKWIKYWEKELLSLARYEDHIRNKNSYAYKRNREIKGMLGLLNKIKRELCQIDDT